MTIEEMYKWAVQCGYEKLPVYLYHHVDYVEAKEIIAVTNHPVISPDKQTAISIRG